MASSNFDIKGQLNIGRPPIGIIPKYLWIEQRKSELMSAIDRYMKAGIKVPIEWLEELNSYF